MGSAFDSCIDVENQCGEGAVDPNSQEYLHKTNRDRRQKHFENMDSLTFEFSNKKVIALDAKLIQALIDGPETETMVEDYPSIVSEETIPEIIINPTHRQISSTETEVLPTNYRIKTIESINDPIDLAAEITAIYSDDLDSEMSYSSFEEEDDDDPSHVQFGRVLSLDSQGHPRKSNMFNPRMANQWKSDDIHELHSEMKQALMDLSQQATESQLNLLSEEHIDAEVDEQFKRVRPSNLYRNSSTSNWEKASIKKQKEEMKKQMLHLAQLQNL